MNHFIALSVTRDLDHEMNLQYCILFFICLMCPISSQHFIPPLLKQKLLGVVRYENHCIKRMDDWFYF